MDSDTMESPAGGDELGNTKEESHIHALQLLQHILVYVGCVGVHVCECVCESMCVCACV